MRTGTHFACFIGGLRYKTYYNPKFNGGGWTKKFGVAMSSKRT